MSFLDRWLKRTSRIVTEDEIHAENVDVAFEKSFHENFVATRMVDKSFNTTIAGLNFPNDDGSSRQQIAKRCARFEILTLHPEPTNPYDKDAILVKRSTGEVVGHLRQGQSSEMSSNIKYGQMWIAVVRSVGSESPNEPISMRIALSRLTPEWVKAHAEASHV